MLSLAVVAGALLLRLGSAAPAARRPRGVGYQTEQLPQGRLERFTAAAHDDSEAAGIETFARDYEISTSYENGSTCYARSRRDLGLDGRYVSPGGP